MAIKISLLYGLLHRIKSCRVVSFFSYVDEWVPKARGMVAPVPNSLLLLRSCSSRRRPTATRSAPERLNPLVNIISPHLNPLPRKEFLVLIPTPRSRPRLMRLMYQAAHCNKPAGSAANEPAGRLAPGRNLPSVIRENIPKAAKSSRDRPHRSDGTPPGGERYARGER